MFFKSKAFKIILCVISALLTAALIFVPVFWGRSADSAQNSAGYENLLFDTSYVHTLDIVMDDFDSFIETCENEEYSACLVIIDGEVYKNVGLRAKGNTSLSNVSSMGSSRYSFKIEFDQYIEGSSYHGLDKLSLNNLIQDNTMMKDYLTYRLMGEFGVAAPLTSYVFLTVNGEDWGLYLAVEGVEESFLKRNYGGLTGDLYKPDSMDMGGGKGNGRDFRFEDFENAEMQNNSSAPPANMPARPENTAHENGENFTPHDKPEGGQFSPPNMPEDGMNPEMPGAGGVMGSSAALLKYTDDEPDSYSLIFDSAKTPVTYTDKKRLINSLKTLSGNKNVESVLDIDALMRYFTVHNFVVNGDSYTGSMIHNYYLYEENGKLSLIPWDYNLAFGGFQSASASNTVNDPIDTPLSVNGDGSRPMVDWIFINEEYTAMYHGYFDAFINSVDIVGIVKEAETLIAPYAQKDPTKFCTYEEFKTASDTLKNFLELRIESVKGQLEGNIPSTDSGQQKDPSELVDASDINISDMGFMGGKGSRKDNKNPSVLQNFPNSDRQPAKDSDLIE